MPRKQGESWGGIIVDRDHGRLEDWRPLIAAVTAGARHRPVIAIEAVAEDSRERPVAVCSEIIDASLARAAIIRTMAKMAPACRGRRQ